MKKVILSAALAMLSLQAFAQPEPEQVTDDTELAILAYAVSMETPFAVAVSLSSGELKTPNEDYGVNIMIEVCRGYMENTEAVVISLALRGMTLTSEEMAGMEAEVAYAAENAAYPVTEYSALFADKLQDLGYAMAENLIQSVSSAEGLEAYTMNLRGCYNNLAANTTFIEAMEEYATTRGNSM